MQKIVNAKHSKCEMTLEFWMSVHILLLCIINLKHLESYESLAFSFFRILSFQNLIEYFK